MCLALVLLEKTNNEFWEPILTHQIIINIKEPFDPFKLKSGGPKYSLGEMPGGA